MSFKREKPNYFGARGFIPKIVVNPPQSWVKCISFHEWK